MRHPTQARETRPKAVRSAPIHTSPRRSEYTTTCSCHSSPSRLPLPLPLSSHSLKAAAFGVHLADPAGQRGSRILVLILFWPSRKSCTISERILLVSENMHGLVRTVSKQEPQSRTCVFNCASLILSLILSCCLCLCLSVKCSNLNSLELRFEHCKI